MCSHVSKVAPARRASLPGKHSNRPRVSTDAGPGGRRGARRSSRALGCTAIPRPPAGKTRMSQAADRRDPDRMAETLQQQTQTPPPSELDDGDAPAIRTQGLSKRYGRTLALDDLDLTVARGEVYGYLGPNGSGKTTTIRLLLGLHRPSAGRAELFGLDGWRDPVSAHRDVAYVAGEPFLWPALTSDETFAYLANLRGGADVAYRGTLVERFQLDTGKRVRALSKGNRQKIQLIAAFRETVSEAKRRGQTVFLSSHILSEVEALCDRVGILRAGRLVDEGTLEELRHLSAQTIEVTFDGPAPQLDGLPGVHVASAGANALRLEVSGSVGPVIAALARHPVLALTSREPSLEEIFLHHYDSSDGRVGD